MSNFLYYKRSGCSKYFWRTTGSENTTSYNLSTNYIPLPLDNPTGFKIHRLSFYFNEYYLNFFMKARFYPGKKYVSGIISNKIASFLLIFLIF